MVQVYQDKTTADIICIAIYELARKFYKFTKRFFRISIKK
jgi:hypothetical protein